MVKLKNKHREEIRLKDYDYGQNGMYFVTICVHDKKCIFGKVVDGKMVLNEAGIMVSKWWLDLKNRFPFIEIDQYVIMPNHMHGIILIKCRGEPCVHPVNIREGEHEVRPYSGDIDVKGRGTGVKTLGRIIQGFKSISTNEYIRNVKLNNWPRFDKKLWQRNYYEHIIRSDRELHQIREYVLNNPLRWELDGYYCKQ